MAENPNYAEVRDGKVVSQQEPVPGPGQSSEPQAGGSRKSVTNMTHAELDAYAEERGVDLTGATTRDDKIDRLQAAQGEDEEEEDEEE